ncbi:MAG TPA: hypothetical protein VJ898_08175 [Natrialbaceae archaeon]|nr:hypothetical protein [Natrialbaceae archaeon]
MTEVALSGRTYRALDIGTTLLGLGLMVIGLEVGATNLQGVMLLTSGIGIGIFTDFIDTNE